MLAKVEVEDEYIFDGVMTKVVSMNLENIVIKVSNSCKQTQT